jgi:hypothetical protein
MRGQTIERNREHDFCRPLRPALVPFCRFQPHEMTADIDEQVR